MSFINPNSSHFWTFAGQMLIHFGLPQFLKRTSVGKVYTVHIKCFCYVQSRTINSLSVNVVFSVELNVYLQPAEV